ncbi:flagellar hook-associated protein FlgL [Nocardioides pocheonensis]|jgi:flagellar hook-associated protein 3 FlgL|uniref:Flagellar hook-associated protein 3 n=1 Tax=Nocardioides pocheonensis TaxID=661485 RepID=A0A3N0GM43_9ACTN|nr:flagellar hook-associated protein FlgL [Nocardioides pocheonensis]RNM13140.1 flagellar hook-associated protein 3 [Nocardioides pocheonensis]
MALTRVTQSMMSKGSVAAMQTSLARLAKVQEQLSTGRVLNRPSDSPTDTTSAMRIRSSITDTQQYGRNAEDGNGWLSTIDSALTNANDQVLRARDLALQGANDGMSGQTSRDALAVEVDQIRDGLVNTANTSYLGRPVFGGITAGPAAYDATGTYVGTPGAVNRTIGEGTTVRVDVDGNTAFGPAGNSVFDHLTALSAALRSGNQAAISAGISALEGDRDQITTTQADVGSRQNRIQSAIQSASDDELRLKNSLSSVENADLPKTIVDLQMQQVAYQASLGATARVMQPSLLDFLR